ncbi:glycoside hydrolase superfamily [Emericellopsis atlantica]|uniref:Alpha-galactosidase n=1 Tax=Emericellopsis atlantica TaxID=2614577 RepID=A0A9P7ZIH7_9HYPO|nr:glycoside hydrolase superfamily [Emericellopsis atlantica]KAG9252684.1 glycoside hydrolase superfamily [Emericellopsis atlantica]
MFLWLASLLFASSALTRDNFIRTAEQLIELGLSELGYEYVNMDEWWSAAEIGRDNKTLRLRHNEETFPGGLKSVADDVHELGLKIGIYADSGTYTCGKRSGSLYYEEIDAMTWDEWCMDYVKVDNCNIPETWAQDLWNGCHPDYDRPWGQNGTCADMTRQPPEWWNWKWSSQKVRHDRMRDALAKLNRTIVLSICNWGQAHVEQWGNETAVSWRMTDDIDANWVRIIEILAYNTFYLNYVDFWGHNDMDMLQIGNGNLSLAEARTHFSLWAALKSPLLISTPLEDLSERELAILKNKDLIDFNQDPIFGKPATPYKWGTNPDWTYNKTFLAEFYAGQSSQGFLVLMFNPFNNTEFKVANWGEVPGLPGGFSYWVKNMWSGEDIGCMERVSMQVGPHDTAVLLVGGKCSAP